MAERVSRGLRVVADAADLAAEGARIVARAAARAVAERGSFSLVLSGSSTPRRLYQTLGDGSLDWQATEVFFGDERCVPPDDPASNYRAAREALLDRVPLGDEAVHRIRGEEAPERAAALYEEEIAGCPRFDLVLLGMGTDGHTASLFPGRPELLEERRRVLPARAPAPPHRRVTLTLPAINAAREIVFLVSGQAKASRLAEVLGGADLPAARVRPVEGELTWLVDEAAASRVG